MRKVECVLKLAIFDMDGLLVDSERIMMECMEQACEEAGYRLNRDYYCGHMGSSYAPDLHHLLLGVQDEGDEELERVRAILNRRMEQGARNMCEHEIPVKPGARELVAWLKERGVTVVVVSSSVKKKVHGVLKRINLYDQFDRIVCGDEIESGKPDPEVFLSVCRSMNCPPKEAIVFEDSNAGGLAAWKGGISYIIVPDLAVVTDAVKEHAGFIAASLLEVPLFLEKNYGMG